MAITYDDIQKVNGGIKPIAIERKDKKGNTTVKDYAEVNQRIKAFRQLFPMGIIETGIVGLENGVCTIKASVYADKETLLATGHAQEKEGSTYINERSHVENCETSAVGRALGMLGIGIDTSIASYEEVANAMLNQDKQETQEERKATPKQVAMLAKVYQGDNLTKLLNANGIEKLEDMTLKKASELISKIKGEKSGTN